MNILNSTKKNPLQYLDLILVSLLIIFDIYFCYSEIFTNVSANSYMIRDIIRTNDIFNWQIPLIGPDTTPGSYSWGPFFYFTSSVLGFFTKINLYSFSIYTITLRFISLFIILIYINKYFKNSLTLAYLCLTTFTFFSYRPFIWINNSSFIMILSPLILLALYHLNKLPKINLAHSILLGLFCALFSQIHFTFLYITALSCFCLWSYQDKLKFNFLRILIFFVGNIIAYSPYLYFRFYETNLKPQKSLTVEAFYQIFNENVQNFNAGFSRFQISTLDVWDYEMIFILLYIIVRVLFFIFFRPDNFKRKTEIIYSLIALFLFSPALSYFFKDTSARYLYIPLSFAILIFTFDCVRVLNEKHKSFITGLLFISYIFSHFGFYKHLNSDKVRPDLKIADLLEFCDFFNKQKISYQRMMGMTYEVLSNESEDSFQHSHFCFQSKDNKEIHPNLRYVVVQKWLWNKNLHDFSELTIFPKELSKDFNNSSKIIFNAKNFIIFEYENSSNDKLFKRLTNLTFSYLYDPGRSLKAQINDWKNEVDFVINDKIDIYETSFCDRPVFCKVFLLVQYSDEKFQVAFVSRIFQSIWSLPPIWAQAKDINFSFICSDVAIENGPNISILGNLDPWNKSNSLEFKTFRSPFVFSLKTNQKCNSPLEISMNIENLTIQTTTSTNTIYNKKIQFTYLGEY
jgi:hypothetical protein